MSDPYSVLGVPRTATDEEIKSAYRKLAMAHHPDRNPGDNSALEKFQKISAAYDTLKDPQKKAIIDRPQSQGSEFHFHSGPFGFGFNSGPNMDGFFRDFMSQHARPQNRSFNIQCQIGQVDAFNGCEVQFTIDNKDIRVKIPRGVDNGSRIRVPGAGENIHPNTSPGDIYVLISILEHPNFKRNGKNIITEYNLDTIDAILGSKIKISTIDNQEIDVEIPPFIQNQSTIAIHKKGMPTMNGDDDSRGDHIVVINLITPTLTDEQILLVKQIKDLQK